MEHSELFVEIDVKKKEAIAAVSVAVDLALSLTNVRNVGEAFVTSKELSNLLSMYEAAYVKAGEGWVNHHPVVVLMVAAIARATGLGVDDAERYNKAFDWCTAWRDGQTSDPDYRQHPFYTGEEVKHHG